MTRLKRLIRGGKDDKKAVSGTPDKAVCVVESESDPKMSIALARESNEAKVGGKDQSVRFEEQLRNSYRQAYNFAYRLTGNAADAEDLVQETYVRAFRFFHRYDEGLPFVNWLCRIMSNAHIDSIRKKSRIKTSSIDQQTTVGAPLQELPDYDSMPDRRILDQALNEHLQQGLVSISPEFRMAVLLADVEGLEYEEIAQVMNTSIGTVRSRIHRGRKQLKRFLVTRSPEFARLANEL